MDWIKIGTIIGTNIAMGAILTTLWLSHASRIDAHASRIDDLFKMFYDLLKEGKK